MCQLHYDVAALRCLDDLVGLQDMRVVQLGENSDFPGEEFSEVLLFGAELVHYLYGNLNVMSYTNVKSYSGRQMYCTK